MNQQEIETKVVEIIIDKLEISKTEINLDSTLKEIGADSFDKVEIFLEIEKKFRIDIPDEILPEVQNIRSLCKYIEKNTEVTNTPIS